ncbi:MAG TPA: lectin like domain-containing protein [Thermoleophilia bacterium]|nr:lectin like domain-containing protein [Thermoleophilia bacterium]
MTTARRFAPALLAIALTALAALAAAPAPAAAAKPEQGPLNPAFVEALHDPLVGLGLGRLPNPVEVHVGAAAQARAARFAAPPSYDLRAEGRLSAVKDQHPWNTCWAFANTAALESKLMPAAAEPDFSEDNVVRRSGYFSTMDQRYDWGGWDFMAVAYFARWAGPVDESADPYDHAAGANGTRKHVQGVVMVPGRSHFTDNDLLKRLVLENGALSAGMYFDPDRSPYSEYTDDTGLHATYYSPQRENENHGVTIVGWDDAYPRERFQGDETPDETPPGDGAFLVRNTWGDDFGEGGYFWVSYYDGSFALDRGTGTWGGCTSYSDVQDVSNYSRIYQYDKLGVNSQWGYGISRVWGANRFTAARTQYIAAAGFYTLSSSTRYEVWAGRRFSSLSLRASGTAELPGYLTVPFAKKLRVYARRSFVVAVKLVSPNETYPMATERRISGWAPLASARRGQSFTSRNGRAWTDVTRVRADMNVCIKAFAK